MGGNGHSAKWSPALGGLAAGLVEGAWDDTMPRHAFEVVFEGDETTWEGRDLWSERSVAG